MEKWISVKDQLPESGQEVLAYFYDTVSERDSISLLTYFKEGEVMYRRIDRDPRKTKAQRFMNTLYGKDLDVKAKEDGFYEYEWDEKGDTCARLIRDFTTHWMELPKGPIIRAKSEL